MKPRSKKGIILIIAALFLFLAKVNIESMEMGTNGKEKATTTINSNPAVETIINHSTSESFLNFLGTVQTSKLKPVNILVICLKSCQLECADKDELAKYWGLCINTTLPPSRSQSQTDMRPAQIENSRKTKSDTELVKNYQADRTLIKQTFEKQMKTSEGIKLASLGELIEKNINCLFSNQFLQELDTIAQKLVLNKEDQTMRSNLIKKYKTEFATKIIQGFFKASFSFS